MLHLFIKVAFIFCEEEPPKIISQPSLFTQFIVPFCTALIPILAFAGTAYGYIELIPAVCQAAEIKKDVTTFVISMAFSSFPMLFAFMMVLVFCKNFGDYRYAVPELAFNIAGTCLIAGFGFGMGAYALCVVNKSLIIAKMKQKDFNLQFFLSNIFVELIGILTFICVIGPIIKLPAAEKIIIPEASSATGAAVKAASAAAGRTTA